jgi:hypothetical protein
MVSTQQYERIGILSIEEVLHFIQKNFHNGGKKKEDIGGFQVNTQSLRLRTFLKTGTKCPICSIQAQFFAVERSKGTLSYHLNLYGLDQNNTEVIFTHDHILARSLGGFDNLSNTITMCGPCNWSKGKLERILSFSENEEEIKAIHKQLEKYLIKS